MSSKLQSRICVSLSEPTVARMVQALAGLSFAEVRLDALRDPDEDLAPLFRAKQRLIATCREGRLRGRERVQVLRRAIDAGARCVDIELETQRALRTALITEANRAGAEIIVSTHRDSTPVAAALQRVIDRCFSAGGHIAKIACKVKNPRENAILLGLLADRRRLVVVGTGRTGRPTRVLAPLLGAEFTFALPDGSRPNALGQLPFTQTLQAMQALQRAMGG